MLVGTFAYTRGSSELKGIVRRVSDSCNDSCKNSIHHEFFPKNYLTVYIIAYFRRLVNDLAYSCGFVQRIGLFKLNFFCIN